MKCRVVAKHFCLDLEGQLVESCQEAVAYPETKIDKTAFNFLNEHFQEKKGGRGSDFASA